MAFWVFNFTGSETEDRERLVAQAQKELRAEYWGIKPRTPNTRKAKANHQVFAYVGKPVAKPERCFVGTAELASDWHEWSAEDKKERRARLAPMKPLLDWGFRLDRTNPKFLRHLGGR